MHKHKRTILIAVGCVILIVFFTSVFMLWRKISDYKKTDSELQTVLTEQLRLLARNPFPSPENILQEQDNLELIRLEFAELSEVLRSGQVEPVQQAPAAFNAQFWKVKGDLMAQAKEKGVAIPADFAFGFLRHMTGFLPDHPDVPRLTQQLTIVQELCKVFYEARITGLHDLSREEFEGGGTSAGGAGKIITLNNAGGGSANPLVKEAGIIPEGGLFGKMHFVFRFSAREAVLRDVLNRLADHRMFIVVTRLELESGETTITKKQPLPGVDPQAVDETTGAVVKDAAKSLTREDRIVCGSRDTPVAVTLEVDVYRFRPVTEPGKQS